MGGQQAPDLAVVAVDPRQPGDARVRRAGQHDGQAARRQGALHGQRGPRGDEALRLARRQRLPRQPLDVRRLAALGQKAELDVHARQLALDADDPAVGEQALALDVLLVQQQVDAPQRRRPGRPARRRDGGALALAPVEELSLDEELHGPVGRGGADAEQARRLGRGQIGVTRPEAPPADVVGDAVGQLHDLRGTGGQDVHGICYHDYFR